ncbi:hypothetical protein CVT25_001780 [Psilocybe cyanescens]|uniref:Uncharacterized protein n=1 Tax=Psilocybe cyanescens TaxID=93625 RepID=A0A409WPN3_PSICY|nr:hypothetical protein CVT25_001780 [Psilocybe cyanescens]
MSNLDDYSTDTQFLEFAQRFVMWDTDFNLSPPSSVESTPEDNLFPLNAMLEAEYDAHIRQQYGMTASTSYYGSPLLWSTGLPGEDLPFDSLAGPCGGECNNINAGSSGFSGNAYLLSNQLGCRRDHASEPSLRRIKPYNIPVESRFSGSPKACHPTTSPSVSISRKKRTNHHEHTVPSSSSSSSPSTTHTSSSSPLHREPRKAPPRRNIQTSLDIKARGAEDLLRLNFRCPVKGCTYKPEGKQRTTDFQRHLDSHESKRALFCTGVRVSDAARFTIDPSYTVPYMVEDKMEPHIGGCNGSFSRRDALKRHIEDSQWNCVHYEYSKKPKK